MEAAVTITGTARTNRTTSQQTRDQARSVLTTNLTRPGEQGKAGLTRPGEQGKAGLTRPGEQGMAGLTRPGEQGKADLMRLSKHDTMNCSIHSDNSDQKGYRFTVHTFLDN